MSVFIFKFNNTINPTVLRFVGGAAIHVEALASSVMLIEDNHLCWNFPPPVFIKILA